MSTPHSGYTIKVHYTGRLDDGRVFASSKERDPLEVTVGDGTLIPSLEETLVEMQQGEERTVTIPADQAYGPQRPELLLAVKREEFPEDISPEVGQRLEVRQRDGEVTVVTVADVNDEQVVIDANHPLAGHDLTFELELVEILVKA
jgi:peptidylprolyl isomerase